MTAHDPREVIAHLWPEGTDHGSFRVHAILDAAQDELLGTRIRMSGQKFECLFAGKLSPRLEAAAPYVVELEPDCRFLRVILEEGWGRSWGLFTVSPATVSFAEHRKHFRSLLRVKDESGRFLLFRFYDPRVLRSYLPTCTEEEVGQFFGPVERLVVESVDGRAPLDFRPGSNGEPRN